MKYIKIVLVVFLITFSSCVKSQKKKQNVLLILVDDLGWTDLGSFGSDLYQSPNVDKLASEGVRFTNSYSSCTVCSPTRASIVTGKYPARLHVTDWIEGHKYPWAKLNVPDWTMYLKDQEYTIAEAFKDAGYKTAHFGKWHLGEKEKNWPENHGFDINIGGWLKGAPNLKKKQGLNGYFSPYGNPRLEDGPEGEYLTERLANDVSTYIGENKDSPFFINLWFYNVHTPLQAKQDKIDKYKGLINDQSRHQNPTYAAMVEHMDDAVGKVIAQLKEQGLYDNTIILFSSDNGGLIGNNPKKRITNNTPLKQGKGGIYEGGTRVPTIIRLPKSKLKGKEIAIPIISMDYYPTLVDLAGIATEKTKEQTLDGKSLAPLLRDEKILDRKTVFWHYPHYHQQGGVPYSAVRMGDWKLIENFETNAFELYNLKKDIGEQQNLINKHPKKVAELKAVLQEWRTEVKAQYPTPSKNFIPNKKWKKK
tara:strand:- start:21431 stop:22861 length:1431 start_codon:yes stop_codon:yes gene_type:complete